MKTSVTVFAPATVANVAVGFDILGFAIDGVGDRVTVTRTADPKVMIEKLAGAGEIPTDPTKNTAGLPLLKMIEALKLNFGFSVKIEKGIPLGSGMGGSAASAVGSVVAANALLDHPLTREQLIYYALEGEAVASGAKHADNIAPCLYGGLTLSRPGDHPDVISLPFPKALYCVLVHPAMRLDTRDGRAVLKPEISLKAHIQQSARLATFVAGCSSSDFSMIKKGLEDLIIEPQRAPLIPGFYAVKEAALKAGVLGCSISGSGPSIFALTQDEGIANRAKTAMIAAFLAEGKMAAQGWVSLVNAHGARVV